MLTIPGSMIGFKRMADFRDKLKGRFGISGRIWDLTAKLYNSAMARLLIRDGKRLPLFFSL